MASHDECAPPSPSQSRDPGPTLPDISNPFAPSVTVQSHALARSLLNDFHPCCLFERVWGEPIPT